MEGKEKGRSLGPLGVKSFQEQRDFSSRLVFAIRWGKKERAEAQECARLVQVGSTRPGNHTQACRTSRCSPAFEEG